MPPCTVVVGVAVRALGDQLLIGQRGKRGQIYFLYTVIWSEDDQAYVGRVAKCASLAAHGACPTVTLQER